MHKIKKYKAEQLDAALQTATEDLSVANDELAQMLNKQKLMMKRKGLLNLKPMYNLILKELLNKESMV